MRFLIIHNPYSRRGGEEVVVDFQARLLREAGHEVEVFERGYDLIQHFKLGRLSSFFSALYNRKEIRNLKLTVQGFRPDVAIVHNLFPVISPAVLPVLKRRGVRVLMTVHNFRLVCPTGLFYTRGAICEKCGASQLRELQCFANCCEGTAAGSFAFAVRSMWARWKGYYLRNVDKFLVLSPFHLEKLAQYGVPRDRMSLLPNALDAFSLPDVAPTGAGGYVGFVGRLSAEKGVDMLLRVARLLPGVRFRVAGEEGSAAVGLQLPENVELVGFLDRAQLAEFYAQAAVVVHTSGCYEGLPLSILEAMYYRRPVVAQSVGAARDLLADECGVTVAYQDAEAMVREVERLLADRALSERLGANARRRVEERFMPAHYLRTLMLIARNNL